MSRTTVVIADRHPVVLCGLGVLLGAHRDFRIVASCSDGPGCVEALRNLAPDLAIVDVALPGLSGLDLISVTNSERLQTRLVFFAASGQDRELVVASAINGHNLLSKEMAPEEFLEALRQIASGQGVTPSFRPEQALPVDHGLESALTTLTDRERQIARLVSEGLSNKAIGRRLNITDGTIKVHLHHVFQKLQVSNRTVLAALAAPRSGVAGPLQLKRARSRQRRG